MEAMENVNTEEIVEPVIEEDISGEIEKKEPEKKMVEQEVFEKVIDKKVAKLREEQEAREKAEKELQELRKRYEPQSPNDIVDPKRPDQYSFDTDDDFNRAMDQWSNTIRQNAIKRGQLELQQQQQQAQQQAQFEAQNQKFRDAVNKFNQNAAMLNISEADIGRFREKFDQYEVSGELRQHIMMQEKGVLIAKHLAENPKELYEISSMDPISAGVYIQTKLAPNLTPNQKSKPPETLEGLQPSGGIVDLSTKYRRGAKFE